MQDKFQANIPKNFFPYIVHGRTITITSATLAHTEVNTQMKRSLKSAKLLTDECKLGSPESEAEFLKLDIPKGDVLKAAIDQSPFLVVHYTLS